MGETQHQLDDLHRTSQRFTRATQARVTASRQTEPDIDDDRGWAPADPGVRLSFGEVVPGTRFRINRWIGEGGMGHVFEAVHVDIQRLVALKVLKSSLGITPDLCAAFLAEARACARIESRFVVRVLDFGVLPDDRPFFAMELLGQDNLHTELEDGPMPLERAVPILRQTCKALAAVHAAGLVHRDVKPENIVLQSEDGRADTVRLVDFGITAEPGTELKVAGTPSYMAPEQIQGADFDGRLDIYSLGCMAYEMLGGAPPFEGSLWDLFEAQKEQEPEPLSARGAGLPAEVDEVLSKCLAKDPEDRWSNVHELEAALCEIQIKVGFTTAWDDLAMPEVDEARRESLLEQMPRAKAALEPPPRRWRWGLVVGLAALVIGLAIGRSQLAAGPAELDSDTNTAEVAARDRIDVLTDAVHVAASRAYWFYPPLDDPDQPTAHDWIKELEGIKGGTAQLAESRAVELRSEIAETLTRLGDKYWDAKNGRPFAVEYYTLALVFVPDHAHAGERSAVTVGQLADVIARAERGELTRGELRAGEVMAALAEDDPEQLSARVNALVDDPDSPLSMRTQDQLIEVVEQGEPGPVADGEGEPEPEPEPEPDARADESEGETEGEIEDDGRAPAVAKARVDAAKLALAKGTHAEAKRLFNEAIKADNRSVDALVGLAELHFDAGEYRSALGYARKAARLRPNSAELQFLHGDCLLKVLRYDDARAAYDKAAKRGHARAKERIAYLDEIAG